MALRDIIDNFERALLRLEESYLKARSDEGGDDFFFFRDSTIQRFEFTVEIFWKTVKVFLKEIEGIDCKTPKSCIREFFSAGYVDEDTTYNLIEMIDYRNLASHTYREEIANEIFSRMNGFINILKQVLSKLRT